MVRCWDVDPARRPLFAELSASVRCIITTMQAMAQHQQVSLNVNYVNGDSPPLTAGLSSDYLCPTTENPTIDRFPSLIDDDASLNNDNQAQAAAAASGELFLPTSNDACRTRPDCTQMHYRYMPMNSQAVQRTSSNYSIEDGTLVCHPNSRFNFYDKPAEHGSDGTIV